jgi:hypothetical protein
MDIEKKHEDSGAAHLRRRLVRIVLNSWRSWEDAATTVTMLKELLQLSGLTAEQVGELDRQTVVPLAIPSGW